MEQGKMNQFVRISKEDHPMRGMIGTANLEEQTKDGFTRVTLLNSSFSGYFQPGDLQAIEVGTKVIIEVEITRFFKDAMMVAGGWMPLSRIRDIVEPVGQETPDMEDSTEYLQDLNGHNAEVLRERCEEAAMPSDAQIEAEAEMLISCWDIEDPAVQARLLAMNEAREQEDRSAGEFYDHMADAQ